MMLRDPQEGWHYDHWFRPPGRRRRWQNGQALLVGLLCLPAAAGLASATRHGASIEVLQTGTADGAPHPIPPGSQTVSCDPVSRRPA